MILGNLAVEFLDFKRWFAIEQRAQRIQWEQTGLAYQHFWREMNRSIAGEIDAQPA